MRYDETSSTIRDNAWALVQLPRSQAGEVAETLIDKLERAERKADYAGYPLVTGEEGRACPSQALGKLISGLFKREGGPGPVGPYQASLLAEVVAAGVAAADEHADSYVVTPYEEQALHEAFTAFGEQPT